MDGQTLLSDTPRKMLAQVEPETGKTKWETLMATVQKRADAGDAGFAKLLARSKVIQANNPEFTRDKVDG